MPPTGLSREYAGATLANMPTTTVRLTAEDGAVLERLAKLHGGRPSVGIALARARTTDPVDAHLALDAARAGESILTSDPR